MKPNALRCLKTACLSCLLLLLPPGSPTTIHADEVSIEHIAFLSKHSGSWEVYIMESNGDNQKRLTYTVKERALTWSPDGKQIAFDRAVNEFDEIYVMDTDGSHQHRLTDKPIWNYGPAWSPDSSQVAFVAQKPGLIGEIHLFDEATHSEHLLTDFGRWDAPSWSPDGKHLALQLVSKYYQSGGVYTDIYTVDAGGQNLQALTENEIFAGAPQWSPDGTQIAYLSEQGAFERAVYVMNVDGSDKRRLTDNQVSDAGAPQWSPDSKSLVFVLSRPTPKPSQTDDDIYTVDISTGALRNLTHGEGTNEMPAYSPDGKHIAFVSQRNGNPNQIYLVDPDGTNLRQLTYSVGGNESPVWQPSPKP